MDKKLNAYFNIIDDLPRFAQNYAAKLRDTKKLSTVIVQITEIRSFLSEFAIHKGLHSPKQLSLTDLLSLDNDFLDAYFLSVSQNSRIHKCSYLNMFYMYLLKERKITYNPLWDYEIPSAVSVEKAYVSNKEVTDTLIGIASGLSLSEKEAIFAAKTQLRDMAVISLLYYQGISLSECAALSLDDVFIGDDTGETLLEAHRLYEEHNIYSPVGLILGWMLNENAAGSELYGVFHREGKIKIKDQLLSLRPECTAILLAHLSEFESFDAKPLFFSLRRSRLSERTIEHMVAKHFKRYVRKHVTTYMLSTSFKED